MHLRWGPYISMLTLIIALGPLSLGADLRPKDIEKARREFWSFKPITDPTVPPAVDPADTPIDRFLRAEMAKVELTPAPDTDRATLIRRLTFDLTGLPPSVEEIDAFVNDDRPNAYERLVDRLLASPRFGERWGRHWLDVARFAESSGGGRSFMFPDAWRYRDYVINSVNADKPMDRFIVEQLAGDLLAEPLTSDATEADRRRRAELLVASGFLALGAHNYELQDKEQLRMDVIDEQIATVGRAFLGMTLDCARCHDHKFDPVPMTDYYALAGIFRSTETLEVTTQVTGVSKWTTAELPMSPEAEAEWESHREALAAIDGRITSLKNEIKAASGGAQVRGPVDGRKLPGIVIDNHDAKLVGAWSPSTHFPNFVGGGYIHDENQGDGEKSVIYATRIDKPGTYEVRISYTPGDSRARAVPIEIIGVGVNERVLVDQRPAPPIDDLFVSIGRFDFGEGPVTITINTHDTAGYVIADAVQLLPEGIVVEAAPEKPEQPDSEQLKEELRKLEAKRKNVASKAPPGPTSAMCINDQKQPGDWHVHIAGLAHDRGPIVPRGFLTVATPRDDEGNPATTKIPADQSGRLELARWIASPENPLTARVLVNRVWQKLIGEGIVRTVDNFGTTGQAPTHPELLDHLASRFIEDGWSLKATVRRIVMTRTYRMSSTPSPRAVAVDPENKLLSHAHRRRIEAEAMRDAMLVVSGQLDPTMGGRTITKLALYDLGYKHDPGFHRRSVYMPAFRNAVPDPFEVFDAATPNIPIGHRPTSILPTQSLYMMNAPEMTARSQAAVERLLADETLDRDGRITLAYRRTLGREPTSAERVLAHALLSSGDEQKPNDRWTMLMHALFASVDFRYLD